MWKKFLQDIVLIASMFDRHYLLISPLWSNFLYSRKKFSNSKTYNAHVKSKKHIEREKNAKENGFDDQQNGTTVNITTEKLDSSKSPEPVVETPVQTEQEFIDEKIANAHQYESNECLICFKIQESFEVYVIIIFIVLSIYW